MNVHEEGIIRAFIVPNKRDRYLTLFGSRKGRRKLTARLNHNHDLDSRFMCGIASAQHSASDILAMLKQRGAPSTCYVISDNSDLDELQMDLKDALSATIGYGAGTIISCIPGELGYYEAEGPGERYLLLRPSNWRT